MFCTFRSFYILLFFGSSLDVHLQLNYMIELSEKIKEKMKIKSKKKNQKCCYTLYIIRKQSAYASFAQNLYVSSTRENAIENSENILTL